MPQTPRPVHHVAHRLGPRPTIALLVVLELALLAGLTWVVGETYEAVRQGTGLAKLDQPTLDWMVAHRSPGLNTAVTAFTTFGGPIVTPIVATVVVIILALSWKSWAPVVLMLLATAGSVAATIIGKRYIDRVRPPHELAVAPYEFSPSFPSGHSLNSMVVGGVIAYLVWCHLNGKLGRTITVVLAALYTLAMGTSRVYLGHHWLTDVVTGWSLGLAWLLVLIAGHRVARDLLGHRKPHNPPASLAVAPAGGDVTPDAAGDASGAAPKDRPTEEVAR